MSTIMNMFARSPIRPLQQHMEKAFACVETLIPFFDAVVKQDWTTAEQAQLSIATLEGEADTLKQDFRLHMPGGLFMAMPRTDLLELLRLQDRVANKAEDIAGLILGRKMSFPEQLVPGFKALIQRSIDAAEQANKAIHELDELLETGFHGSTVDLVTSMVVELGKIEHDTDTMQATLRQALFALESDLPPVDVIFMYKVIEWIGDLADRAESTGGYLQLMMAK